MLFYLSKLAGWWGPLRLFRYVTFRTVMAIVTALLWMFVYGPRIFDRLRRIKFKDVLRDASDVGRLAHLHAGKNQTPTGGGIAIVFGVTLAVFLWARMNVFVVGACLTGWIMGFVGFLDDSQKIRRRDTKGLSSHWKWWGQGIATVIPLYLLLKTPSVTFKVAEIWLPFSKIPLTHVSFGWLFFFWFLVLSGTSNAINLTDGIDGLAIGCTITVALTYTVFAYISGNVPLSHYLHLCYLPGSEELCILCGSIVGASLGFLWYNAYPAQVFMGDTGSLALGAWIGSVALMTQQSFTLVIVGFIFVLEATSVILQVGSFKLFGRRIFKMTPLHHHFELKNIHESKIIVRFWIVSLLCSLAGLLTLKLR
jgi:phospho-N-acetylmuramoyl-pentapeptide-transferase